MIWYVTGSYSSQVLRVGLLLFITATRLSFCESLRVSDCFWCCVNSYSSPGCVWMGERVALLFFYALYCISLKVSCWCEMQDSPINGWIHNDNNNEVVFFLKVDVLRTLCKLSYPIEVSAVITTVYRWKLKRIKFIVDSLMALLRYEVCFRELVVLHWFNLHYFNWFKSGWAVIWLNWRWCVNVGSTREVTIHLM